MSDLRDPLEAERLVTEAPDAPHTRADFLKRTAVTAGRRPRRADRVLSVDRRHGVAAYGPGVAL